MRITRSYDDDSDWQFDKNILLFTNWLKGHHRSIIEIQMSNRNNLTTSESSVLRNIHSSLLWMLSLSLSCDLGRRRDAFFEITTKYSSWRILRGNVIAAGGLTQIESSLGWIPSRVFGLFCVVYGVCGQNWRCGFVSYVFRDTSIRLY